MTARSRLEAARAALAAPQGALARRAALARDTLDVDWRERVESWAWAEHQARRDHRAEALRARGFAKRSLPCFTCGRFKARPADVCAHCGDDPVSHGGDRLAFNRAYGYAA